MRESQIEQKLVKAVKAAGGIALKFFNLQMDGLPDRVVLLSGGRVAFVEVKSPGKKPTPLQAHRHEYLKGLGFEVHVLDDPERIKELLNEI